MSTQSVGYLALLRRNTSFRRLWYGQLVSQLGDWFDSIAIYALVYRLTGSGQAVGALLVAQFLPATLVGPWAGVLIDRLPRKLVMVATDLVRAALVLLLLLVQDANQLWLVYAVTVSKFTLTSFFEPARAAAIPTVTSREELVAANAITGATWSAVLAIGAALGGLVAGTLGTSAAFLINSGSFLLSAVLIGGVRMPEAHVQHGVRASGWSELREGSAYMASRRDIALYMYQGFVEHGRRVLLLLTLYGRNLFPIGVDAGVSIGLLYAARGLGAGIGPIIAQRLGGESGTFMRRAIGPAIMLSGLGYILFSGAPVLVVAALAAVVAHAGGSIQWVYSTVLLQLNVPNRLQGRIFAVELALLTLTTSISSYLVGLAADAGWPLRLLGLTMASVFLLTGATMTVVLWRMRAVNEKYEV